MSLIRSLNLNSNFLSIIFVSLLFFINVAAEEKSVDIWNNEKEKKSENINVNSKKKNEPKIDISKINQDQSNQIEILDSLNNEPQEKLVGLYDPGKNDLSLEISIFGSFFFSLLGLIFSDFFSFSLFHISTDFSSAAIFVKNIKLTKIILRKLLFKFNNLISDIFFCFALRGWKINFIYQIKC